MLGASRREQLEHNLGAMDVLPRLDADVARHIERAVADSDRAG
jgi:aryl-alcohol dehydrogenase-like predicted oxidoreductase